MRTTGKIKLAIVTIATIALSHSAPRSRAAITGSPHDLSQLGWSQNQICLPCHASHNTVVRDAGGLPVGAPLWNHALTTATYTLYVNPQTGRQINGQIDASSRMCLSCHDGTVALDSFGGGGGTQQITNPSAVIGTDLSNDHPIGEAAIWPNVTPIDLVDQRLRDNASIMPLLKLPDGRQVIGCTTCHEPHNRKQIRGMLWTTMSSPGTTVDGRNVSGSVLCFNCHKMGDSVAATGAAAGAAVGTRR